MKRIKVELVDIEQKKEAQILQDISMTHAERFVRMFDLIEFCSAFSRLPKIHDDIEGVTVITLKKVNE